MGYLDLIMQPEHCATPSRCCCSNFHDIPAARWTATSSCCEELFSAAKTEFEDHGVLLATTASTRTVWKDNFPTPKRREDLDLGRRSTNTGHDYKVIFVGSRDPPEPYEITYPGGSVEHWNEEPGRHLGRPGDAAL